MDIPLQFEERVLQMPEYSYGVTRVTVTLEGGHEFSNVFIAWGREIVKVGATEKIPFDPSKIIAVRCQ